MAYIRIDISSGEIEEEWGTDKDKDKEKGKKNKEEGIDRRYEIEPGLQIVPITEECEEDEELPPPCWDPEWLTEETRKDIDDVIGD